MTSIRKQLAEQLATLLPDHYRFVTTEEASGTLSVPTVFVRQRSIEPGSTFGSNVYGFVITIAVPTDDLEKAEDDLDSHVEDLLFALDSLPNPIRARADKQLYADSGLSYELTVSITARKDA